MIESVIEFCCRNRFIVILAFVALAVVGGWVVVHTPVDAIPDLSENQVIVFTDWMGRSPQEIEDQITYPLSVNLQGLAGVKAVRSSSEFNFSMINIIFDDSVDFYFARTRVLERLALANTFLPQGVVPYLAPDATALGQIFWYTVEGDNRDLGELRAIQDWYVRYQLNAVPGVAQVSSVGGFPREYQVDVTPERMRAYNVTLGDIYQAIARSNSAVGGRVVQKGNAEYIIRGVGWLKGLEDLRKTVVATREGTPVLVEHVATVQMGSEFRRSVLEKDGREVTGGVVMMRYGENPLEVTRFVKDKIRSLQQGLPEGVRIVPFYDRTRLIEGAIHTVTKVLEHETLIATIAILLILLHFRSVLVIVVTLPLSVIIAFILMRLLGISSNIMSLSGIAISIGILVDQAIVMLENATHRLSARFGTDPIKGDTTEIVVAACRQVGRPIFFSVVIMVISFLPVFALGGQEGKLFHPLAFTKTFALIGTALISITLVPALIPLLVRGRLSREENNWIVRSVVEVYRPVLGFLMHRPKTVIWLFVILVALGGYFARHMGREFMPPLDEGSIMDMPVTAPRASVTEVADDLKARDALMRAVPEVEMVTGKAGRADTPTDPAPLDMLETVINLHPKTLWVKRAVKRADAVSEAEQVIAAFEAAGSLGPLADDKARHELAEAVANTALERFDTAMRQEVSGRIMAYQQERAAESVRFIAEGVQKGPQKTGLQNLLSQGAQSPPQVGGRLSPAAGGLEQGAQSSPQVGGRLSPAAGPAEPSSSDADPEPHAAKDTSNAVERFAAMFRYDPQVSDVQVVIDSVLNDLSKSGAKSPMSEWSQGDPAQELTATLLKKREADDAQWTRATNAALFEIAMGTLADSLYSATAYEAGMRSLWKATAEVPPPDGFATALGDRVFLWARTKDEVVRELDGVVHQLGWANIWTQPIINRVDMLATGVRTQLAAKVFGTSLEQVQDISNRVAEVLRGIPGAADVVADQTVGKGYVEIEIDRARAARYGINVGDIQDVIEVALGGKTITTTVEGRERYPVRLRYARDDRDDEASIARILVSPGGMEGAAPSPGGMGDKPAVYLSDVAAVRVVEGPVMIKSENGLLRSYVQLNVRDRDVVGFVEEAQRTVAAKVSMPAGCYLEWTGQFEHQVRAKKTLRIVFPTVLLLIYVILYLTYKDLAHASLMMLAVPGALAGGVLFQALFGYNFSVAVWVGYIACFGMATETGIIMLVYLRDALAERGGLPGIGSLKELEQAVMAGAIHRLRPKLLTEATAIVGLAPMLWAHGVGAEVIAPMAAPVLGGLLVADEVIDVFLPVLFYHVEKRRWMKAQRLVAGGTS